MMKKAIAILFVIMTASATQAGISTGSANVKVSGGENVVFPEQDGTYSGVRVVAQMRESDPTVMDVTYIVYTNSKTTPVVNVRALAFENGERGFATVVRPETWVEGTETNIGDGIAANVAHRLSWRVSTDWNTDLAKVKFEVMAMKPGDLLLPMHFVTIPAVDGHPKITVSTTSFYAQYICYIQNPSFPYRERWGTINNNPYVYGNALLIDALFWLYASNTDSLTLNNGVLFYGGMELVRIQSFYCGGRWDLIPNACRFIFGKMGYRLLGNSDELSWINENSRLGLIPGLFTLYGDEDWLYPDIFRQFAVKTIEE